jgi:hypothetical protein
MPVLAQIFNSTLFQSSIMKSHLYTSLVEMKYSKISGMLVFNIKVIFLCNSVTEMYFHCTIVGLERSHHLVDLPDMTFTIPAFRLCAFYMQFITHSFWTVLGPFHNLFVVTNMFAMLLGSSCE